MAEQGSDTITFRRPDAAILGVLAGPATVAVLGLSGSAPLWMAPVGGVLVALGLVTQRRQRLILDAGGVTVTVFKTRHMPWAVVREFRRGSLWSAATIIATTEGDVRSSVPCSKRGGRPDEESIAELNRYRVRMLGDDAPASPARIQFNPDIPT